MIFNNEYVFTLLMALIIWCTASFFASIIKAETHHGRATGSCNKNHYIDYVLFTKLFCEVETNTDKDQTQKSEDT